MASVQFATRVTGLAEFRGGLKTMRDDAPKAMRLALNEAGQLVVDEAKPKIAHRSGAAGRSVQARAQGTSVRVVAGGKRALYYPWLDFGGKVGKNKSVHRKFMRYGRYLYPAYFEKRDSGDFERVLQHALVGLAERSGVAVT